MRYPLESEIEILEAKRISGWLEKFSSQSFFKSFKPVYVIVENKQLIYQSIKWVTKGILDFKKYKGSLVSLSKTEFSLNYTLQSGAKKSFIFKVK